MNTFARLQFFSTALIRTYSGSLQTHLQDILTAYTKKQLTNRKDRLNGISGILEEVSKICGPFFQGVPLSCFSNAILWDRDFLWFGFPQVVDERSC